MGGLPGTPSLEEAMMDIESCLGVLEYLARMVRTLYGERKLTTISSCTFGSSLSRHHADSLEGYSRSTRQYQLNGNGTSPSGRNLSRGAPISSSRDDPLPHESFPAPLPLIALPYEFSLLDNLFLNPMSSHIKASDYTNGNNRAKLASEVLSAGATVPGSFGAPPQGYVPGSFDPGTYGAMAGGMANGASGVTHGLGAYGMATQVMGGSTAQNFATNQEGGVPVSTQGMGLAQGDSTSGNPGDGGFDIFNFLMDEEGGLGGTSNWDALDIPADFSLWS
jgi:hypothetical protein